MRYFLFSAFSLLFIISLIGCNKKSAGPIVNRAVAVLHPTEGNQVTGQVTFTRVDGGMKIEAHVNGLIPGDHGFHIHQYGDCSGTDGKKAGGHFNPENQPHAAPDAEKRHVGDLGNLTANEHGHAMIMKVDPLLTFEGRNSIIGRGVIVHAGADDLTSQPAGAAGARLACGVVGIAGD